MKKKCLLFFCVLTVVFITSAFGIIVPSKEVPLYLLILRWESSDEVYWDGVKPINEKKWHYSFEGYETEKSVLSRMNYNNGYQTFSREEICGLWRYNYKFNNYEYVDIELIIEEKVEPEKIEERKWTERTWVIKN